MPSESLLPEMHTRLRTAVGPAHTQLTTLSTLEQVVRWGLSLQPPRLVAQVITQDEYTLDVCLPVADDLVLVFDSTWLGGITAVAGFDHLPDADELLDRRVAQGWRPTATSTVDGDVIMGHACHHFGRCPPEIHISCGA